MTPQQERVKIFVSNQRGYIWDVRDVQSLRVNHHICGVLLGTLPQVGQQNVFLGIPLMLLPDEVVLLVRNNLAVLIDDRAAHHPPTMEQANQYDQQRQSAIRAQQKHIRQFEQEKKLKMAQVFKDKIEKKRLLKLEESQQIESRTNDDEAASAETGVWQLTVPHLEPTGRSKTPVASTRSASTAEVDEDLRGIPYKIMIQGSSTDAAWHDPSSASYSTLESAKEAGVWDYPTNQLQQSRSKVFEDMWSKRHFMGGGLRFGGDFLVYPGSPVVTSGDPLRYHSHFTLTVLSSSDQNIMPLDLISYGRLATAVKKAHLLASWDEKEDKVEYFSLEWAAMG
ncbi:BQ2448_803 [Microbotryum intermedium]|uniref:tRNA-splicing endonuclease subunit Sen34 n=1 Tax=Microbotryum intermedium TaxID=269621 RepID=A0A238F3E3_9BASI|nr:BQ2448_803 [Microbotryum intermedium]